MKRANTPQKSSMYIEFQKLQHDAINADFAARMFLFIMRDGVERGMRKVKKKARKSKKEKGAKK